MPEKNISFKLTAKNKTKTAFGAVTQSLRGIASQSAKLAVGLGVAGVASAAAFSLIAKRALDSADAIGKTASRVGLLTGELQQMRFAFGEAGVAAEAVDSGLLNFVKRLGKAREGIGALAGGLKGSNLELLETIKNTNSTSEALRVVFDAMGAAKDQAEKLAIADAAFGGAGLKMTAAFNDGTDAFLAATQAASDLGLILSDEAVRGAEAANDAIGKVVQVIQTMTGEIVGALAPTLTAVFGFASEGFAAMAQSVRDNRGAFKDLVENGVVQLLDSLVLVVRTVGVISNTFKGLKFVAIGVVNSIAVVFRALFQTLTGLFKEYLEIISVIPLFQNQLFDGIIAGINGANAAFDGFITEGVNGLSRVADEIIETDKTFTRLADGVGDLKTRLSTAIRSASDLARAGSNAGGSFADALADATNGAGRLNSSIQAVGNTAAGVSQFISRANFTPTFRNTRQASISAFSGGASGRIFDRQVNPANTGSIFTASGGVPITRTVTNQRFVPGPIQQQATTSLPTQAPAKPPVITINLGGVTINGAVDQRTAQQLASILAPEIRRQLGASSF